MVRRWHGRASTVRRRARSHGARSIHDPVEDRNGSQSGPMPGTAIHSRNVGFRTHRLTRGLRRR
jgi:hypothetical protein